MLDLGVLLGTYQLSRIVGELTGLIESIGVKLDRLAGSSLDAGLRSLDQATRAAEERKSLLRSARTELNKAIALEKDERLLVSYLALAVTHKQLGDWPNTRHVLEEFLAVEFLPVTHAISEAMRHNPDAVVKGAVIATVAAIVVPFVGLPLAGYGLSQASAQLMRQHRIDEMKRAVRKYLESSNPNTQTTDAG
jgi:hypothetical protein